MCVCARKYELPAGEVSLAGEEGVGGGGREGVMVSEGVCVCRRGG